jgi:putative transposase
MLFDLTSRLFAGCAVIALLSAALTISALPRAVRWRKPRAGLLAHTHRGLGYAQLATPSMSRRRDCRDNPVAESCFATLVQEVLAARGCDSNANTKDATADFSYRWHSIERPDSTLGCESPLMHEQHITPSAECYKTRVRFAGFSPVWDNRRHYGMSILFSVKKE